MEARDQAITSTTKKQITELQRLGWYHSIELPGGRTIEGFQSLDQLRGRLSQFPIPQDLTGKRVLDVGAWDGWFSFEMERRGAEVVAVDAVEKPRFLEARALLDSKVRYIVDDVLNLRPQTIGQFDIVLFLGVLYHLKHPLLALERISALCRGMACIESYVIDGGGTKDIPLMEFYETTELRGQFDNWVGPNTACLLAFCRTAGFPRVEFKSVLDNRCHVVCYSQWLEPTDLYLPPPVLIDLANSLRFDHVFSAHGDYVSVWFRTEQQALDNDSVFLQVGQYGARPVGLEAIGENSYQVCCGVPPALQPGWHDLRLRTSGSAWSNPLQIGVDVSIRSQEDIQSRWTGPLAIVVVSDGKSWERNLVRLGVDSWMSLWVAGIPESAKAVDVRVRLNGTDLPVAFLSSTDKDQCRQVNIRLPSGLRPGGAKTSVIFEQWESAAANVQLVTDEQLTAPPR